MKTITSKKRISKLELAKAYLPDENISNESKMSIVRKWITDDEICIQKLEKTKGYNKNSHFWSDEQIDIIFNCLGAASIEY